jgi:hypothetical protein
VTEHEHVDECRNRNVNGAARTTAKPPKSTPTTATDSSVTSGESPIVFPMCGLTT